MTNKTIIAGRYYRIKKDYWLRDKDESYTTNPWYTHGFKVLKVHGTHIDHNGELVAVMDIITPEPLHLGNEISDYWREFSFHIETIEQLGINEDEIIKVLGDKNA